MTKTTPAVSLRIALLALLAALAAACFAPSQAYAAGEQDIAIGMFYTSDTDYTNQLFVTYDGENLTRVDQVYKVVDKDGHYSGGHSAQTCPSIMYYNGYFWSLSGWNLHDGKIWVTISYSKDLKTWTHPEGRDLITGTHGISVDTYPTVDQKPLKEFDIVAPEWSVASDGSVYIVVSCGYYGAFHGQATKDQMQVYVSKVTELSASDGLPDASSEYLWPSNLRFSADTAIRQNLGSGDFIDGQIYSEGGVDYLIVKKDGLTNQLYRTTNLGAKGGASWQLVNNRVTFGYEAPSIAKLNGKYFLYTDHVTGTTADGVRVVSTNNLTQSGTWGTPHDPSYTDINGNKLSVNKVRHGTVITLKAGTPEWKVAASLIGDGKWERLAGGNRYTTMQAIVQTGFETSDVAVVATGQGFADALAASALAGANTCPVVLTKKAELSDEASAELDRLQVKRVYIMGGENAVSPACEAKIAAKGIEVTRLAGPDRYATSLAIYQAVREGVFGPDPVDEQPADDAAGTAGDASGNADAAGTADDAAATDDAGAGNAEASDNAADAADNAAGDAAGEPADQEPFVPVGQAYDTVIIATGSTFADSLSIAPYSYATNTPIVLARKAKGLPDDAVAAIKADEHVKNIVIVGGTAAVPDMVKDQLGADYAYTRLGGTNRYETSKLIAEWELGRGFNVAHAAVATGKNYPDALAGAALCGVNKSVLLLASDGDQTAIKDIAIARKAQLEKGYFLGGTSAVSSNVQIQTELSTRANG